MLIVKLAKRADRQFEVEKDGAMKLGSFQVWVRNNYQIPGKLTLYYGERKLDDTHAALRTILPPGHTLRVAFNKFERFAAGGLATGGKGEGPNALGEGGRAGGGHGGLASTGGGDGEGGAASGASGAGGIGIGGPAAAGSAGGTAEGGQGIGGDWSP
jgi:hypothetical protein